MGTLATLLRKIMKILAIETSCDDTSVAIVNAETGKRPRFEVLSSIVSSQIPVHKKWGGVVPNLAKREHQKNIVPVLIQVLKEAKLLRKLRHKRVFSKEDNSLLESLFDKEEILLKKARNFLKTYDKPDVDEIAVTIGPGLEPSLWVGVNFAEALSSFWKLPLAPVNHIEAHILANWLSGKEIVFPALCLLVSGGHTQLVLMEDFNKYKVLGETRDDAAGECFDKTARILGLGYPGGPTIAKNAASYKLQATSYKLCLPRPMINHKNYDFSFSGLKTAVLYDFKGRPSRVSKSKEYIQEMCREIQQSIVDVLIDKTVRAAKEFKAKTIILGGGVAANKELRKQMEDKIKREMPGALFSVPDFSCCTDNAAMVAAAAAFNPPKKQETDIKVDGNLKIG